MERAEGGEGKSGDGGKTSFEIFTLCHSYSLMDSLGRGITTPLWPRIILLAYSSPLYRGNFFQGNASGVKLCFKSITFDAGAGARLHATL